MWDKILTSTPVVLTVLATLLAGLSSSEMSRAQYYRALAAQHQSKAGDQWAFFQAKRIRGTEYENTVELMGVMVRPVPVTREALAEAAARLPEEFNRAAMEAERLLKALDGNKGGTSTDSKGLRQAAEKLQQRAAKESAEAKALQQRLDAALASPEVQEALGYLGAGLPEVTKQPVGDERIREARAAIDARKSEKDTAPLMAKITDRELNEAMEAAEANATAFDAKGKPLDKALDRVAKVLDEQAQLAQALHYAASAVSAALPEASASGSSASAEVRAAASGLEQTVSALVKSTDALNFSFGRARRGYTARRYEREARDNQEIAGVYEIQVRKSSWLSERHQQRSILFFFGMLAAQAGTVIATFALAVRQKSALWGLATLAGLGAIIFSGYVYVFT
jgi:hypothetical protein